MNNNLPCQSDRLDIAMNRIESIDNGSEVIKSVVEAFREPGADMIAIDNLEAFLNEMEGFV